MSRYPSNSRAHNGLVSRSTRHRGSSLIEVMLAVALLAVTTLGLIAGQLWIAREARAMAMREHAAWIADAVAEAMREPAAGDAAIRQWSALAAALLPHGEASVRESGGVSAARVTWAALRNLPRADDVIDKPESCGGADVPAGSSCVALAFAK
ncbi:prepilin-type N-terminal cleavage/methylation domain-containing protein [Paraburkholderia fungorum]|uniref:Prepilin-type N-terminal cleavage/methylation domain-containing protein n=1 Tax=Paraburkholderia fungorum TaxID=134537 RepID=A0AAP5UTB3_9BURK|nr:prepilin-type N-terminal cleavage/methylation domain-containing protein [Paraburkholderia fungorum]MDT8838155.1 prepilin-type N-terminal cleavage/methylation domain-containing protein [Paraburkholderia fungorum]PRZ48146.1 pilin/secretion family protein with methylation motif [Paraburkholderia fungorum]